MKRAILITGAVALGLAATMPARSAELVTNGNFDNGFTGWSTTNTVGIGTDTAYQVNAGGTGSSGAGNFVAFGWGNLPGGSIMQTLSTVVGQTYTLAFSYGVFGGPTEQNLLVTYGSNTAAIQYKPKAQTTDLSQVLDSFVFTFTAASTLTTLKFQDVSFGTNSSDGFLDNVSVQAVPGPIAGAGLPLLAGLVGYGLWRRRRANRAA